MSASEVAVYERTPHHDGAVLLRRADEAAKVPGRTVAGLEEWTPVLVALASAAEDRSTAGAEFNQNVPSVQPPFNNAS
jgi:hypothetical protein